MDGCPLRQSKRHESSTAKKKKDEREGGRKKEIYLPSLFMFDELIQITQDYWGFRLSVILGDNKRPTPSVGTTAMVLLQFGFRALRAFGLHFERLSRHKEY